MSAQAPTAWPAIISAAIFGSVIPFATHAHVKWFVDTSQPSTHNAAGYSIAEPAVLVWLGAILVMTVIALVVDRLLRPDPPRLIQAGKRWQRAMLWILRLACGGWLLFAAAQGTIFVPNFVVSGVATQTLLVLEIISGFLLISGLWPRVAGKLLIALYIGTAIFFGWREALDHLWVVGVALYLILVPENSRNPYTRYRAYAVPLLRLTFGISLVALAFNEKLLDPSHGLEFLSTHHWNFMQQLGLSWFDDRLFILSVGASELLYGWLYILGLVTRLNTMALLPVFIVTAFILGPTEVIGHLPLLAIGGVLLLYGGGDKLTVSQLFPTKRSRQASLPFIR